MVDGCDSGPARTGEVMRQSRLGLRLPQTFGPKADKPKPSADLGHAQISDYNGCNVLSNHSHYLLIAQ